MISLYRIQNYASKEGEKYILMQNIPINYANRNRFVKKCAENYKTITFHLLFYSNFLRRFFFKISINTVVTIFLEFQVKIAKFYSLC